MSLFVAFVAVLLGMACMKLTDGFFFILGLFLWFVAIVAVIQFLSS